MMAGIRGVGQAGRGAEVWRRAFGPEWPGGCGIRLEGLGAGKAGVVLRGAAL